MSNNLEIVINPEVHAIDLEDLQWHCPQCGETGIFSFELDDPFDLGPHGTQHADGPFGKMVKLEVSETPFS